MDTKSNSGRALALASVATLAVLGASAATADQAQPIGAQDTKALYQEAYVYALPLVMNYGVMYQFAIDRNSGQYKAPFNQLKNDERVFTPADTAIQTPNSDTPYSIAWLDLRAEPVVVCVPAVDKSRYYSVQLVDMNTFNFGYIGSRATGSNAGCYMVAGPDWKGETPKGIAKVFRSESQFVNTTFRTQLFSPDDMRNVVKIQSGYKVEPLSTFEKTPPPPAPPKIDWPVPTAEMKKTDFIKFLNFLLSFDPTVPEEATLRAKFSAIGIGPGKPFDYASLSDAQKARMSEAIKDGYDRIKLAVSDAGKDMNGWRVGSVAGDRAFFDGDYMKRSVGAVAGIYGNSAAEAIYPLLDKDSAGEKPDGSKHDYALTFAPDQLPPANAFWSITMYDGATQLLIANPINRYLINSPMMPGLKKNADGSLTIYISNASPRPDKEANWLPAPNGLIYLVMRLYWPKPEAVDGSWAPPPVVVTR